MSRSLFSISKPVVATLSLLGLLGLSGTARALDFISGCGIAGRPVTGWNGHTDTKHRTVKIPCGQSKEFTVQFDAALTQGDINAGGFIFTLVDDEPFDDDLLLKAEVECAGLAAMAVGTDLIGDCTFTLKCTSDCILEGVSIKSIDIYTWPGLVKKCSIRNPAVTTGSSGESDADLALEDTDDAENEFMCNGLEVQCTEDAEVSAWEGDPRATPGEVTTMMLSASQPAFTDATDLTWGLDGRITHDDQVLDPQHILSTLFVPEDYTPGPLTVYVNNVEAGVSPLPFTIDPLHWAQHDAGNIELTVTDRGILGALDPTLEVGLGLHYPTRVETHDANHLFVGSFWLGREPIYVANLDYEADPSRDWVTEERTRIVTPPGPHDQMLLGTYSDAGAPAPMNARIEQLSYAYMEHTLWDAIITGYSVTNLGPDFLDGLVGGLFLDLDMGETSVDDIGGTDRSRNLAYEIDADGTAVGVMWLGCPDGACETTNVTLIHNPTSVWPMSHIPDPEKFAFLSGFPEHTMPDGPEPDDYSVLVAARLGEPLPPGGVQRLDFAVLGGQTLAQLLANADAVRAEYNGYSGADPFEGGATGRAPTLRLDPNPSSGNVTVRFVTARAGKVGVDVYDAGGRLVRRLAEGMLPAGQKRLLWDGREPNGRRVASGVYFVRVNADGDQHVERLVVMR